MLDEITIPCSDVKNDVIELSQSTNLITESSSDIKGTMSYLDTFKSFVLSSIWLEFLTTIYDTNLVSQCRTATLNMEQVHIRSLVTFMKDLENRVVLNTG